MNIGLIDFKNSSSNKYVLDNTRKRKLKIMIDLFYEIICSSILRTDKLHLEYITVRMPYNELLFSIRTNIPLIFPKHFFFCLKSEILFTTIYYFCHDIFYLFSSKVGVTHD